MQISKNKNMCIFLMSQVSLNSKIRFLSQKVCPVARSQTDRHTDRVTTEGTLSGFQDFFLQPIIKDRPNKKSTTPSCSGQIPAQKLWTNSVLGVVFYHTMLKMDFHCSHRFS